MRREGGRTGGEGGRKRGRKRGREERDREKKGSGKVRRGGRGHLGGSGCILIPPPPKILDALRWVLVQSESSCSNSFHSAGQMNPLYILSASSVCLSYSTSDYLTKYEEVYHASRYPVSGAEKVGAPPPPLPPHKIITKYLATDSSST